MSDPLVTSQHSYMDLFNGNAHEKWRAVGMAAQELEVVSVDRPAIALSLQAGQTLLLGRGTLTGTTSSGVSRQHCTLLADHSGHGARLVVLHRAGAAVVRARRNLLNNKDDVSPLILLSAGQSYEMAVGDAVYLERRGAQLVSGFVLRHRHQGSGHAPQSASGAPELSASSLRQPPQGGGRVAEPQVRASSPAVPRASAAPNPVHDDPQPCGGGRTFTPGRSTPVSLGGGVRQDGRAAKRQCIEAGDAGADSPPGGVRQAMGTDVRPRSQGGAGAAGDIVAAAEVPTMAAARAALPAAAPLPNAAAAAVPRAAAQAGEDISAHGPASGPTHDTQGPSSSTVAGLPAPVSVPAAPSQRQGSPAAAHSAAAGESPGPPGAMGVRQQAGAAALSPGPPPHVPPLEGGKGATGPPLRSAGHGPQPGHGWAPREGPQGRLRPARAPYATGGGLGAGADGKPVRGMAAGKEAVGVEGQPVAVVLGPGYGAAEPPPAVQVKVELSPGLLGLVLGPVLPHGVEGLAQQQAGGTVKEEEQAGSEEAGAAGLVRQEAGVGAGKVEVGEGTGMLRGSRGGWMAVKPEPGVGQGPPAGVVRQGVADDGRREAKAEVRVGISPVKREEETGPPLGAGLPLPQRRAAAPASQRGYKQEETPFALGRQQQQQESGRIQGVVRVKEEATPELKGVQLRVAENGGAHTAGQALPRQGPSGEQAAAAGAAAMQPAHQQQEHQQHQQSAAARPTSSTRSCPDGGEGVAAGAASRTVGAPEATASAVHSHTAAVASAAAAPAHSPGAPAGAAAINPAEVHATAPGAHSRDVPGAAAAAAAVSPPPSAMGAPLTAGASSPAHGPAAAVATTSGPSHDPNATEPAGTEAGPLRIRCESITAATPSSATPLHALTTKQHSVTGAAAANGVAAPALAAGAAQPHEQEKQAGAGAAVSAAGHAELTRAKTPTSAPALPPAEGVEKSTSGRHASAPSSAAGGAAVGGGPMGQGPVAAGSPAGVSPAAAHGQPGATATAGRAGPGAAAGARLFAGCRFVFWARAAVRDVLVKVKAAGGAEDVSVGPHTTHVVARYDTPAEEASERLRVSALQYSCTDAADGEGPDGGGGDGGGGDGGGCGGGSGAAFVLPPGMHFVIPRYLRDCLQAGALLPPEPYLIALHKHPPQQGAQHASQPAGAQPPPRQQPQPQCQQARAQTVPEAEAGASTSPVAGPELRDAGGSCTAAGPAAAGGNLASRRGPGVDERAAASAGYAKGKGGTDKGGGGGRRGLSGGLDSGGTTAEGGGPPGDAAALSAAAAVPAAAPAVSAAPAGRRVTHAPRPEDICPIPEAWGVDGRWIEPWDDAAARRTCQLLLQHWTRQKGRQRLEGDDRGNGCAACPAAGVGAGSAMPKAGAGPAAPGGKRRSSSSGGGGGGSRDTTDSDEDQGECRQGARGLARPAGATGPGAQLLLGPTVTPSTPQRHGGAAAPAAALATPPSRGGGDAGVGGGGGCGGGGGGGGAGGGGGGGAGGGGGGGAGGGGGGVQAATCAGGGRGQQDAAEVALELAGTGGIGADGDSSDGDRDKDEDDSDSDNGGGGGGAVPRGAVCDHPCCAARPFCIIAELRRTRDNYMGRVDQFRIKALNNAMTALAALPGPLAAPGNVDALKLGKKTTQKIKEILATGHFARNEVFEANPQRQTMQLFTRVWGCADATAQRWWRAGCRTLDDVRQRLGSELTAQQRIGLRYFDDFAVRIPRDEVTELAAAVRQATLDELHALTGLPAAQLTDRLHVRPTGSYARGADTCKDVDFIIAPGPAADPHPALTPARLLLGIVRRLRAAGRALPEAADMAESHFGPLEAAPRPPAPQLPDSATWLGVMRGEGSGRQRRVDIKVCCRAMLPYAINYFISGTDFNRALRYWCNTAPPAIQAARRVHPGATCFKLSDRELVAVTHILQPATSSMPTLTQTQAHVHEGGGLSPWGTGGGRGGGAAVGGAKGGLVEVVLGRVECRNETDIFRAVGLSYVPPHMRAITRVV